MKTRSGYIEAGWTVVGNIKNQLTTLAWHYDLQIETVVSTSLFSRRIDWRVTGDPTAVDKFHRDAMHPTTESWMEG